MGARLCPKGRQPIGRWVEIKLKFMRNLVPVLFNNGNDHKAMWAAMSPVSDGCYARCTSGKAI